MRLPNVMARVGQADSQHLWLVARQDVDYVAQLTHRMEPFAVLTAPAADPRNGAFPKVKTPPSVRPNTAGLYISSACAGGRTKTPGVVARAR